MPGFRSLILFSALAFGLTAADTQAQTGSFERSYAIDGTIKLDIKTDSGSIKIRSGRSGHAEVIGHARVPRRFLTRSSIDADELLRRFEANPPVELSGGRLSLGRNMDKDFRRHLVISYEVVVPATTEVRSRSDSGSQSIAGISGPVDVSADSGDVKLTSIGASAKASTDSGDIVADGISGAFQAHTDSGDVRLIQNGPGDVFVSTDSGSSNLRGVVGALRVNSDSGDIVVVGKQNGAWALKTDSGSVRIKLSDDAAFKIDARSSSSAIYIDHPVTVQGKVSKNRLTGDVRGGGSVLKIRTDSGGIRVE